MARRAWDILKHVHMSDDYQRIELITGTERRRRWTMEQKLQISEAAPNRGVGLLGGTTTWRGTEHSLLIATVDGGGRQQLQDRMNRWSAARRSAGSRSG